MVLASQNHVFGPWTNVEKCKATGEDKKCGPGYQIQKRTCIDEYGNECKDQYVEKEVSCTLPPCVGE